MSLENLNTLILKKKIAFIPSHYRDNTRFQTPCKIWVRLTSTRSDIIQIQDQQGTENLSKNKILFPKFILFYF